jgi:hypothetical protein
VKWGRREAGPAPVTSSFTHMDRPMVAAAQILASERIRARPNPQADRGRYWQREAWDLYDETAELFYATRWRAASLSRVRLVAARRGAGANEPETIETGPAADLVAELAGGAGGQADFLARAGAQIAVSGESYLIGRTLPNAGQGADSVVQPYSSEEVIYTGSGWSLDEGYGAKALLPADVVVRAWMPHPRRMQWPDSAVRSLLPVLRELRALTMHVSAQVDSRLAGAGLLLLPAGMTYPSPPGADGREGEDPFIRALIDAMRTPINDRDVASAIVPLVAKVPDETVGKAQYLNFSSQLDLVAKELRDEAVRRVALGLDLPPEMVLGVGANASSWSSWQIAEDAVRLSVVPLAVVICHALTVGFLRPQLDDPDVMVWYDTTPLDLRPDRSKDALNLYDRMEITGAELRAASGFNETSKPTDAELKRMIALALARQGRGDATTLDSGVALQQPSGTAIGRGAAQVNAEAPDTDIAKRAGSNNGAPGTQAVQ